MPLQGLSGSHAYSQGKVAGTNAAGGSRKYQPVYVPWGMVAGKWMIGGVSFGETLATALGIPFVLGKAQGISRARYYPDVKKIMVKLLAEPGTLRLIGAQMVGGEGIKERADFLAMAVKVGITLEDLAFMENVYSPPIGALNEPIALAAQNGLANLKGLTWISGAGVRRSRWLRQQLRALPAPRRAAAGGRRQDGPDRPGPRAKEVSGWGCSPPSTAACRGSCGGHHPGDAGQPPADLDPRRGDPQPVI